MYKNLIQLDQDYISIHLEFRDKFMLKIMT